jgi:predicted Ser/Thr protein kinase
MNALYLFVIFLSLFAVTNCQLELVASYQVSATVIVARRLRIESYGPAQNLSNCAVWIDSYGKVPSGLFVYSEGVISPSNLPNAPSTGPEFSDADVVDGSFECNIVSLNSTWYEISGSTLLSVQVSNAAYISVSSLDTGPFALVINQTGYIAPIEKQFSFEVESRRLAADALIFAAATPNATISIGNLTSSGLYNTIFEAEGTKALSISIAVHSPDKWVVCFIWNSLLRCVFSNDTTQFVSLGTQPTIYSVAISYIDCEHLAVLTREESRYRVAIYDVDTRSLVDTYASSTMSINGLHQSATVDMISILVSNSTGVYLEILNWSRAASACTASEPIGAPFSAPNAPNTIPTNSPISTPDSIQPNTAPTTNSTNLGDTPPPGIDSVGVGVGVSISVAVVGVGAFLLVFFLRKRKKNKKEKNSAATQMNPVSDLDGPSSVQANTNNTNSASEGERQNLQSSNANEKYTPLGLTATSKNDSFIVASAIDLPNIEKRLHIPYKSLVFVKEIGAGSYGKVFSGEWRGAKVAIKVNNQITDVDGFLAEAKLSLGIAPHPNLVQTFGVSLDGPNPCIVLEYCGGGSLDQLLFDLDQPVSVEKQREFAIKIAYGLLHLHNNNIVHRDLAARNILLTNDRQPKISDFGMSRLLQEENSKGQTLSNIGPIRWMSPESLKDRSYSTKSDVWTFGITVNEIISRQEPHANEDQLTIAARIRDHAVTPIIPEGADPVLVEVIKMCLKAHPSERPTMEDVCTMLRSKVDANEY